MTGSPVVGNLGHQGSAIWDPGIPNPGFFVNKSQIPIPDPRFLKPIPNPNPRSQIFKIKSQSQSQILEIKSQSQSQILEIPENSAKSRKYRKNPRNPRDPKFQILYSYYFI